MAAAAAKHAAAVNEVAGERLRLVPQRSASRGGAAGGADASRATVEFIGTVTRRPLILQRTGNGAQGGTNAQVADAAWQVGFPASLRLAAEAGDHVERLEPPAGEPALFKLHAALPIRGRTIHLASPVD